MLCDVPDYCDRPASEDGGEVVFYHSGRNLGHYPQREIVGAFGPFQKRSAETNRNGRGRQVNGKLIGAIALVAINLGACGSIVRGTDEQMTFVSTPSGANVVTTKGYSCAATPCTIAISRSDEFDATFSLAGYHSKTVPIRTKIVTNGGAAFAGNILAGGVIGMGVDAYTGAAMDHEPNPVVVTLAPVAAQRATRGRRNGMAPGQPGM